MAFHPDTAFEYLEKAENAGRLGHAFLISGPPRSGKTDLAQRLAALVNGIEPETAFANPDVVVLSPSSKSRRITVERIRELEGMLHLKSSGNHGGRKVGIILEADRLMPQAANAFLKTLEEPPEHCLLILISASPERMLETILSRCIKIPLRQLKRPTPSPEELQLGEVLKTYFEKAESGLPAVFGLARDFESILSGVKQAIRDRYETVQKEEVRKYKDVTDGKWLESREEQYKSLVDSEYLTHRMVLTDVLIQWWTDVLRCRNAGAPPTFVEFADSIESLAKRVDGDRIFRRLEALENLRENFDRNVQEELAIEVAFLVAFGRAR